MKICIILGTRPEIIKMSSIIRACQKDDWDFFVLHTNQHYDKNLDKIFFNELELAESKYNLEIGSGTHGEITGKMLIDIEKVLVKEKPDVVLVEGDTNTVLAGALAASKLHIKIGHVEAGLRSYDRQMPEETNRVLTDHMSDYLFAPTEKAKNTALKEGIDAHKIYVTGNTIVDAVEQNLKIAQNRSLDALTRLKLQKAGYILVTAHREENVDSQEKLQNIFTGLASLQQKLKLPLIYPIHPRTKKRIKEFGLNVPSAVKIIDPVGFLDFLQLEAGAKIILTDSGGIQEEACILNVPCVTLRENTERPETLKVKANILAGTTSAKILECAQEMLARETDWENPFGDGQAGQKILQIITDDYKK